MSDLSIHPVYLSARAAIVAPERAIPVTIYSTQKWLPRLGPERWCLVMLLRSLSIDAKRRSDGTKRVSISWRQLAEILDVHEETVASWLKHKPIPNDKPWRCIIPVDEKAEALSLFIPRLRYAYETHNGKTRRTGFLLEILMEDPVVPEDESRLKKQMEILQMQQGELGLETYRLPENVNVDASNLLRISDNSSKPRISDSHYVNQLNLELLHRAKSDESNLHGDIVNPNNLDSLPIVKQHNVETDSYVNSTNPVSLNSESEDIRKNVNKLDILIQQLKYKNIKKNIRREVFEPVIELTELLLEDRHSTGMLYKALNSLYPERLDLYVASVRVALDAAQEDSQVNRGAVFVRALREFADTAGIDLGLKRDSSDASQNDFVGNPGSQQPGFIMPSVDEAIWSETQLMLRRQMTQATYDAIIQGTTLLGRDKTKYIVGVHSEMAKEWLENRLRDIVQRTLSNVVGESANIEFRLLDETGIK